MIVGIGNDIIEIERVEKAISKEGFIAKVYTQREIENMLLDKYFKDRGQITIDSLIGNEKSEDEMIEEGYDLANKEIGYRMEKLK